MQHSPGSAGLTLGPYLPCSLCASCKFAVSVSLELLKAGLGLKGVVFGFFSACWN